MADPDQRHGFDHTGEPGTSSYQIDPKPGLEPQPAVRPRYGTVAAAGPFSGRGGWWSYGRSAPVDEGGQWIAGMNLIAALEHLDYVAVKYPLDFATVDESASFVHDVVWPKLRHDQWVITWEQDSVVGATARGAYAADAWIGVGESETALETVKTFAEELHHEGWPVALATTFVPTAWPAWAVAMFEMYQGDGTPILDNTPLAQLAALGAPAVIPIVGGFGGVSLDKWFPQLAGQGFPGVSAWTVDAYSAENVALLGSLPWAGTDAKAAA